MDELVAPRRASQSLPNTFGKNKSEVAKNVHSMVLRYMKSTNCYALDIPRRGTGIYSDTDNRGIFRGHSHVRCGMVPHTVETGSWNPKVYVHHSFLDSHGMPSKHAEDFNNCYPILTALCECTVMPTPYPSLSPPRNLRRQEPMCGMPRVLNLFLYVCTIDCP
jgi:hypothetical protein